MSGHPGRESILQSQLEKTEKDYDFVIIDCPPNLTLAPQNALVVSDYIIVPVVPEIFPAIGLPLLINRIKSLKKRLPNCEVDILGIMFTKVKRNTNLHKQQIDSLRKANDKDGIYTFQTIIPETVRISEAISESKPALLVNPNSDGVESYRTFVNELLLQFEEE